MVLFRQGLPPDPRRWPAVAPIVRLNLKKAYIPVVNATVSRRSKIAGVDNEANDPPEKEIYAPDTICRTTSL